MLKLRVVFFLSLSLIWLQCRTPDNQSLSSSQSESTWAVSGYLHDQPNKKVWVSIQGDRFTGISEQQPAGKVLETDGFIFPGLIDMHGHIKYHVLPLWGDAVGQFKNRFEWRTKYPAYKNAVSFNMKAFSGDMICAAVRWAELKSLTSGVTSMQGIGGDTKCASEFGVNNLDINREYGNSVKIRSMTDIVMPDVIRTVFEPHIAKHLNSKRDNYDEAFAKFLQEQGVEAWIDSFNSQTQNFRNGLALLIGSDHVPGSTPQNVSGASQGAYYAKLKELNIGAILAKVYDVSDNGIDKALVSMSKWLEEYSDLSESKRREEKTAFDFVSKGGVYTVASSVRRYLGMFEFPIRRSALEYLKDPEALAIVAHMAEGAANDPYNQREYDYLKTFGLTREGMVLIHGVGMTDSQLADAAARKISIVWSPFSNLLLYGETLDVKGALKHGINLALGSDWSPTGSKHLLDEMKLARAYASKSGISLSAKELFEMATINAAKALKIGDRVGQVKKGYLADFFVIDRCQSEAYDCLLKATQESMQIVAVKGQPMYGDRNLLQSAGEMLKRSGAPESIKYAANHSCANRDKTIWLPSEFSNYDQTLAQDGNLNLRTYASIKSNLEGSMAKYRQSIADKEPGKEKYLVKLDPAFSCEDGAYRKRFASFVETEIQRNRDARKTRRASDSLQDQWNPLGDESLGSEEPAEDL